VPRLVRASPEPGATWLRDQRLVVFDALEGVKWAIVGALALLPGSVSRVHFSGNVRSAVLKRSHEKWSSDRKLLLSVMTYRTPEMNAPESVHVAWEKAARYLVKMVHAPLRSDLRVDVEAVKKRIDKNAILIVGSAPSYPHGVIDLIPELDEVVQECGVPRLPFLPP